MKADIKKIKKILELKNLTIPPYQRPYRWTKKNVLSLLEDIYASYIANKNSYRIGNLILHLDNNKLNVVDGQQRITTLLLIFKALNNSIGNKLREKLEYNHNDSKFYIKNNFSFLSSWINENILDKDKYANYISNHCEFVIITTDNLSEAFQMFDSQNTRGKELEPYNLLKAFHIRSMVEENEKTKIKLDQKWEEATLFKKDSDNESVLPKDLLKQLFNEQLYRTRKWSEKLSAFEFNKNKIDEFKGENIDDKIQFPYQNKLLLQLFAQSYFNRNRVLLKGIKRRISLIDCEFINPFVQINQRIINGKNFFEYILTYTELYKILFENIDEGKVLNEFKEFYKDHCFYLGAYRSGDSYLREVYKSAIFLMFDRFGEDGVRKFHKILYSLIYRIRFEKYQVKYNALAKSDDIIQIFYTIEKANNLSDLMILEQNSKLPIKDPKFVKNIKFVKKDKNEETHIYKFFKNIIQEEK